jgi:hypothetical protein
MEKAVEVIWVIIETCDFGFAPVKIRRSDIATIPFEINIFNVALLPVNIKYRF